MISRFTVASSPAMVSRSAIRSFSLTPSRAFITNFLNSRKSLKQKNEEIVEKQDDEKPTKVIFLNAKTGGVKNKNSQTANIQIQDWKKAHVLPKDIENTYNNDSATSIIEQAYQHVTGDKSAPKFADVDLTDLELRFNVCKEVQSRLGFDIPDYSLTKSHTLADLKAEVLTIVNKRWTNERNPNEIVVRGSDFGRNVYINEELGSKEQKKLYNKLVREAKTAAM